MNNFIFKFVLVLFFIPANTFADSQLIRDLDILDIYAFNFNASHWIEQSNLQKGVSMYGEVNIPIVEIPDKLLGADFIQTSISSNGFSGDVIAYFVAGEAATLYIAHSVDIKEKPKWLSNYNSTNEFIKTEQDVFELFKREINQADTVALGNNGSTESPMYFVTLYAKNNFDKLLPSGRVFDVREFGAVGDNKAINTKSIQTAIDKCSVSKGGGVVYIADGVYLSGTLELKSNVTLFVEKGAILRGSMNHADYPQLVSTIIPSFRMNEHFQFLFADNQANVRITGGGVIDGNSLFEGFPWKGKGNENERPRLIKMIKCYNVSVDNITLIRSANWTQYYEACRDLKLLNQNIRCYTGTHNQDAMDISGCKNVVVRNINAVAGDDVVCIKSLSMEVGENILIENVFSRYANCHLVKVGTETHGGVKNLTVRNVTGTARYGIAIECVDGAVVEDVLYENITLKNCATPLFIRLGNRGRTFDGSQNPAPQGVMRNITIRNVKNIDISYVEVRNGPGVGSAIAGIPSQRIQNLKIENCDFLYFGSIMDQDYVFREIPENEDSYPEFNIYGICPAYGLYFRHIDGLTLKNVNIRIKHTDTRPPIVFEHVDKVEMKNVDYKSYSFTVPFPVWFKSTPDV